jgi:hypothetical protein
MAVAEASSKSEAVGKSALTIDAMIAIVQGEFPEAKIRITGRARTIQRQAVLMADRRIANRNQFLKVYAKKRSHIAEMDEWAADHPSASKEQVIEEFGKIIRRAKNNGVEVSHHLSDHARDISIPLGGKDVQKHVRARIKELGGSVLNEAGAVGGSHWHVDFIEK